MPRTTRPAKTHRNSRLQAQKARKSQNTKAAIKSAQKQMMTFEDQELREAFANIPKSWCLLDERIPPEPKKRRVTFYLDEDIYDLFANEGVNWQCRIRAILRSFVALKLQNLLAEELPDASTLMSHWYEDFHLEDMEDYLQAAHDTETRLAHEEQKREIYAQLARAIAEFEDTRAELLEKEAGHNGEPAGEGGDEEAEEEGGAEADEDAIRADLLAILHDHLGKVQISRQEFERTRHTRSQTPWLPKDDDDDNGGIRDGP